jgi:hypothetical protein
MFHQGLQASYLSINNNTVIVYQQALILANMPTAAALPIGRMAQI